MIVDANNKERKATDAGTGKNCVPLTIYLPDCSPMSVSVKKTGNFKEVILQILIAHEKQGIQPPLIYDDPDMYELRIHEGA
jgi:hypothetical protein